MRTFYNLLMQWTETVRHKKKPIFYTVLLLLVSLQLCSQTITDSIRRQFQDRYASTVPEKMYVHSDKSFYMAGETMFVKLYCVDGYFHQPSKLSKIAYIEIISREQKPVLQSKFELNSGQANGSIYVPGSMPSGNYLLRAYTSWMKNFGSDMFFEKIITVINSSRPLPYEKQLDSGFAAIQFFPESGKLVHGLKSTVAFQVRNSLGESSEATGFIMADDDTLLPFSTMYNGRGTFDIIPDKNKRYEAIIKMKNDQQLAVSLPEIFDNGYVLSLKENSREHIEINIQSGSAVDSVYLLVSGRHRITLAVSIPLIDGAGKLSVDSSLLSEGVNQIVLYDKKINPVAERLYYKIPKSHSPTISIENDLYEKRAQVNVTIFNADQVSSPISPLSVSVALIDSLQPDLLPDIEQHLWMRSDLIVSNADLLTEKVANLDSINSVSRLAMLTSSARQINWSEHALTVGEQFLYLPEYEGHIIEARIINKIDKSPGNGIPVFITIPGDDFHFRTSISDSNGLVRFVLKRYYGEGSIIVQTDSSNALIYQVETMNPYFSGVSKTPIPPLTLSPSLEQYLRRRSIYAQAESLYQSNLKEQYNIPEIADSTAFYGTVSQYYLLDNYTRFLTLEEVLREYVIELKARKLDNQYKFQLRNSKSKQFFEGSPLVLMDGLPIFDLNQLMAFDPLKIERIDLVTERRYFGKAVYDGIVHFRTYNRDLGQFPLAQNILVVSYPGMEMEKTFYQPDHLNSKNERLPDFRNVLLWQPSVKLNTAGKAIFSFFCSDVPGEYSIIVEGFTKAGVPVSTSRRFTVRSK